MARRRKKAASNPLAQWGYPSAKELRNQAGQIASASVPTVKSIKRPYTEQKQSLAGFLEAVTGLLTDSAGQVGQTYSEAGARQDQINAAAQQRLASLGLGDYAAGTQATAGARGDSASAAVNQMGAAAGEYASKQPGIAAGYASVQRQTIDKNQNEAINQRNDARMQAYVNALQTVQANALNRAGFLAGRKDAANSVRLQTAQMAQSQSQFEASQAQSRDQFNRSQAQQWKEFLISQADKTSTKNQSKWDSLTPGQQQAQLSDIADSIHDAKNGIVNPNYGSTKPDGSRDNAHWILRPNEKKMITVYNDLRTHGYSQRAILQTMQRSYSEADFSRFMAGHFPNTYNKIWGKTVTTPPGYQH